MAEHLGIPLGGPGGVWAMSSTELNEWIAWEKINGPLGATRRDLSVAGVAQTIIAVNTDPRKRSKIPDVGELVPFQSLVSKRGRTSDPFEILSRFAAFAGVRLPADMKQRMNAARPPATPPPEHRS